MQGWLRPHATVRGRLLGLLLVASLPVILLAALGSFAFWRGAMDRALQDVALERDRVVAANRAAIEGLETMLPLLAATLTAVPEGAHPDPCELLAAQPARMGIRLSLRDASGGEVCAGTMATSGQWIASVDRGATLGVSVPLSAGPAGGALVAVLIPRGGREDAAFWLVDRQGGAHSFGGQLLAPRLTDFPDGPAVVRAADGGDFLVASAPLTAEYRLAVAVPAALARHSAWRTAMLHMAEVAALLALSATAVLLGTAYAVTRPLRVLREAVARWDAGSRPFEIPPGADLPEELEELAASIRAGAQTLARREGELRAAIDHAELLAGEVHHRVKNNLQTVSSLLALQANRVSDPVARVEFEAARDRVGALATLHRHLYVEHDPEAIDFGAFIAELGAGLFAAIGEKPGRRIALDVEAPSLRIGTDQAVPLALVITEAVADALRQGFPEERAGRIAIRLTSADGRGRLDVEDDGALPRPEDPLRAMLLRGLGRQLGGTLKMEGGRVELDFPLRPPAIRQPVSLRPPTPPPAPSAPA
jgi:two-component sensor histidine kinase